MPFGQKSRIRFVQYSETGGEKNAEDNGEGLCDCTRPLACAAGCHPDAAGCRHADIHYLRATLASLINDNMLSFEAQ